MLHLTIRVELLAYVAPEPAPLLVDVLKLLQFILRITLEDFLSNELPVEVCRLVINLVTKYHDRLRELHLTDLLVQLFVLVSGELRPRFFMTLRLGISYDDDIAVLDVCLLV